MECTKSEWTAIELQNAGGFWRLQKVQKKFGESHHGMILTFMENGSGEFGAEVDFGDALGREIVPLSNLRAA